MIFRHFWVVNTTESSVIFDLYLGASGDTTGGTELVWSQQTVAPGQRLDWYDPGMRVDVGEYIVGGAETADALVLMGTGEIGIY